jgi:hypothetical protein
VFLTRLLDAQAERCPPFRVFFALTFSDAFAADHPNITVTALAVPDAVMARYLIQDHRFLDSFLVLLGAALATADVFAARLRFGRFIGMAGRGGTRRLER